MVTFRDPASLSTASFMAAIASRSARGRSELIIMQFDGGSEIAPLPEVVG
jgi:hypothetical protein